MTTTPTPPDRNVVWYLSTAAGAAAVLVFLALSMGRHVLAWQPAVIVAFGLLLAILAMVVPRATWASLFQRHFGWAPAVVGLATYPFWYFYGHAESLGSGYFDAAAQVLPLLLLAAILDVRRSHSLDGYQLITPMLVVLIGEMSALGAIAFQSQVNQRNFAVVAASIVTAVVALVFAVLADTP